MLELLRLGAKDKWVPLTTVDLARKLNKSQQMASKHLEEMEREGLILRTRSGRSTYLKVTAKGASETAEIYSNLESIFGKNERAIEVEGAVFEGLGEAAYYVSQAGYREQFIKKLGFEPYPGTLNIRLGTPIEREIRRELSNQKGIHIEGFKNGTRSFGGAECFRALLNRKTVCAVLVIERTHYDDSVLEIIASQNLRKSLRLAKGAIAHVKIFFDNSNIPQ